MLRLWAVSYFIARQYYGYLDSGFSDWRYACHNFRFVEISGNSAYRLLINRQPTEITVDIDGYRYDIEHVHGG